MISSAPLPAPAAAPFRPDHANPSTFPAWLTNLVRKTRQEWITAIRWRRTGQPRPTPCRCCRRRQDEISRGKSARSEHVQRADMLLPCFDRPAGEEGAVRGEGGVPACARCKALHGRCEGGEGE
ncbi:hypothetical protein NEMBOFW57_002751 [Staphylotrichum longicolle]|uniref:Uncharacterized protein n=1 Tax=Staphylotrichum longicolle TaxID=669026 RepID=A0AAD4I221_9PEZI|nr:hypothetical protein NEMBOFW57_002751 [Staphylotrichum longicolle]